MWELCISGQRSWKCLRQSGKSINRVWGRVKAQAGSRLSSCFLFPDLVEGFPQSGPSSSRSPAFPPNSGLVRCLTMERVLTSWVLTPAPFGPTFCGYFGPQFTCHLLFSLFVIVLSLQLAWELSEPRTVSCNSTPYLPPSRGLPMCM